MTEAQGSVQRATSPPLGPTEIQAYCTAGFLVVPATELSELRQEATAICCSDRGAVNGVTPAPPDATDMEVPRQYLCLHFPHKISEIMARYLGRSVITGTLQQRIGPNVKCMQSMLFVKASGKPGQAWHQDEFFIPTRDCSLHTAWITLDDAAQENGCLWVIPGSHKDRLIWSQRDHNDPRFDCTGVKVTAGSTVLFNGHLLHRSFPNRAAPGRRWARVNHYMSAESLLPWFPLQDGVHQGINDFRDIVRIASRDLYAWMGRSDAPQGATQRRRGLCQGRSGAEAQQKDVT